MVADRRMMNQYIQDNSKYPYSTNVNMNDTKSVATAKQL